MTEKIQFKAANPPKTMKYDHFAHSAMELGIDKAKKKQN